LIIDLSKGALSGPLSQRMIHFDGGDHQTPNGDAIHIIGTGNEHIIYQPIIDSNGTCCSGVLLVPSVALTISFTNLEPVCYLNSHHHRLLLI
jgi:hypothetical protein